MNGPVNGSREEGAGGALVEGLVRDWTFVPSRVAPIARLARATFLLTGLRRAPPSRVLRALEARDRWNGYFLYLPAGGLTSAHRYTLAKLRALSGGLLAICATPDVASVPPELLDLCDAVVWKGLSGYDFSAYAVALAEVAAQSPGADLLLMNDSVLGPFVDLDAILRTVPWQMTGFTASTEFENHLQSYALYVRSITPPVVQSLRTVAPQSVAFDRFWHVVYCQETRLARVAARTMKVGALWFAGGHGAGNPSLTKAVPLLTAGFPFLKRSIAGGKLAHRYDQKLVMELLAERSHPVA
jgi:hypothetical protein